jgi:hypothetical protein
MTNFFKKAAELFGNWTSAKRIEPDESAQNFMEPDSEVLMEQSIDTPMSSTEFAPVDGAARDWSDSIGQPAPDTEAAIAAGEMSATPFLDLPAAPDQAATACDVVAAPVAVSETVHSEPIALEI